MKEKASNVSC